MNARDQLSPTCPARGFEFERDTFAFANELWWAYLPDPATGRMTFRRRTPRPAYAHRCFVLVRAARQFHYHARFAPQQPPAREAEYRHAVQRVLRLDPRRPSLPGECVVVPGFAGLREFSTRHESLLKELCGGAWRSYVLRSHWRMVFPLSRQHQQQTAQRLASAIGGGDAPVLHLVRFPQLTINHGLVAFSVASAGTDLVFGAYDPNDPRQPTTLRYQARDRTFHLPPNAYWAGGRVDVIEILRGWWF